MNGLFLNKYSQKKRLQVKIFLSVDIQTPKKRVNKCYNYADAINAKGKFTLTSL